MGGEQAQLVSLARAMLDVYTELQRTPRNPHDASVVTVVVGAEGRRIRMHKQVLTARMPYFHRLFRFHQVRSVQLPPTAVHAPPDTTVRLPELEPRAVSALCKYAYTSKLMLMPDTVRRAIPWQCAA